MAAQLQQLLTLGEIDSIKTQQQMLQTNISSLTVDDLRSISLMLIKTDYKGGRIPNCILAAKAIEILTQRARRLNIDLY
jgi:hypothetical protein